MKPYSFESMSVNCIFQHDNDPKHSSRLAKCGLSGQSIDVLYWPPQSLHLNPIENFYGQLLRDLKDKKPQKMMNCFRWYNKTGKTYHMFCF